MRGLVMLAVLGGCQPEPLYFPDAGPDAAIPATCTDGTKNGTETAVDCGGACGACADGQSCFSAVDCTNGTCFAGTCGPRMWFAESTGNNVAVPGNQVWTAAPGASVEAVLHRKSMVLMRWTGTSRYGGGGNEICHLGQRFVVDGTPTGHATWGNAIMVQRGTVRVHEPFSVEIAMLLEAGTHTITTEMTNATGYAACNLDGDGGLPYDRSHLAVAAYDETSAWYAESTGSSGALPGPSAWTNIPGAELTIPLTDINLVQISLSGTQHAAGAAGTHGHCAYRLVVDNAPLGDANHGQAISVGDVAGGWWAPVSLKWGASLAAGTHTVRAQVRNSGGASGTCEAGQGNNPYAKFRLFATASAFAGANVALESTGASQYFGPSSAWTLITGLETTIDNRTNRASKVMFEVDGTQRTLATGASYCGYRLVVDDVPLGHSAHGQAINMGDGANAWWSYIGMAWGTELSPGPHQVRVEGRNSSAAGECGTNGDNLAYGRMRMLVRNL